MYVYSRYVKRGLPRAKAQIVVEIFAKDPKVFVDIMMVEELGIMPEDGMAIRMRIRDRNRNRS